MAKRKKKQTKKPTKTEKVNAKELLIGALIDLIVGIVLILIDKLTDQNKRV